MNKTVIAASALVGLMAAAAPAAVISISQLTTIDGASFLENTNGDSATWTIISTAGAGNTVKINALTGLTAVQQTNDTDDLIDTTSLRITADGCTGMTLANGQGCSFNFTFNTIDNSGVNDGDSTTWSLLVTASGLFMQPGVLPSTFQVTGSGAAKVLDPTPEPSGLLLLGSTLAVAAIMACRKRTRA